MRWVWKLRVWEGGSVGGVGSHVQVSVWHPRLACWANGSVDHGLGHQSPSCLPAWGFVPCSRGVRCWVSAAGYHYSGQLSSLKLLQMGNYYKAFETIISRGNTGMGPFEPLVTICSSTNQYRILFFVCFCLKTSCLIDTTVLLT